MWDPSTQFFYDIDSEQHDRIPIENIVGFDPFMAGIADCSHISIFDVLTDPEQFKTKFPIPSTIKRAPVYAPDSKWNGEYLKGPHGCMWNGPTWPFTNSTALMSIAKASLMCDHRLDPLFSDILRRYTLMCFRNGNIDDPMIYEHYNPETGGPISEEEDYFHSTWIDLIVRYVAGITPLPGRNVEFHPIHGILDSFLLDNVQIAGHEVSVEYDCKCGYKTSRC